MNNSVLILAASLLSGLITLIVSIYWHKKSDIRASKIKTLKNFAANRYDLKGLDFTKAINEIFVVFNDSNDAMGNLNKFHEAITKYDQTINKDLANNRLVSLFKSMCKDIGVNYENYNDDFFLRPFNAKK